MTIMQIHDKSQVHYFSMQIVINIFFS